MTIIRFEEIFNGTIIRHPVSDRQRAVTDDTRTALEILTPTTLRAHAGPRTNERNMAACRDAPSAMEGEDGDDWERMEESGQLDKQIRKLKIPKDDLESNGGHGCSEKVVIVDEGCRNPCMASEPQIKILKRDAQNEGGSAPSSSITLNGRLQEMVQSRKEREVKYAEARSRIFGESKNSESLDVAADDRRFQSGDGLATRVELLRSKAKETTSPGVSILRSPRGPDGSKGFESSHR
ncbi:unnamed protein product [Darwinula stevensoni]|uniref:SUZ RNA-binding domain-containing n=1 Tax=Darwinula stevensoni TaxID=69355 RepID=A0A7R9A6Z2_9CRUS|nr:unnamed protein product [Darwinula stevensoni]CAG0889418.1 unnamed protein product [Darwinula stevensoni]